MKRKTISVFVDEKLRHEPAAKLPARDDLGVLARRTNQLALAMFAGELFTDIDENNGLSGDDIDRVAPVMSDAHALFATRRACAFFIGDAIQRLDVPEISRDRMAMMFVFLLAKFAFLLIARTDSFISDECGSFQSTLVTTLRWRFRVLLLIGGTCPSA